MGTKNSNKSILSNSTYRLTLDAMLAAMVAVLGYVSIDLNVIKITFETLPIFIGAFLLGPLDGMAIGGIGTLVYQLLRYGFAPTTALWIVPYLVAGLICGLVALISKYNVGKVKMLVTALIAELIVTALNTGVIYIDSKVNSWYYPGIILGSLAFRIGLSFAKGIVFGAILPYLTDMIKNIKVR